MTALVVVLALALQAPADEAPPPTAGPSCLVPAWFGAAPCAATDAAGGLLLGMGALFASFDATGGGDDCVEQCVLAAFTVAVVSFGVVLGVAGAIVLGPVAAIAVVGVATVATLIAARHPLPPLLGGAPGILLGAGGLALAAVGFFDVANDADLDFFDVSRGPQQLLWAGVALSALGGPASLVGAVAADAVFGGPIGDPPSEEARRAPLETKRPEASLPRAVVDASIAY